MQQGAEARARIRLLGGFELNSPGGRAIPIASRKGQGLLAILSLSPGMAASRDRLAGLLWSDRGDGQARNSLRQALVALRKELGDGGLDIIEVERDQVRLVPERVAVDAAEMARLAGEARLAEAAALYGGALLDGIHVRDAAFEDWASGERQRLADLAFDVHERVYDAASSPERLTVARRLLALDPLREAAHRAVMQALAAAGERNQALRQYEALRDMLARELGTEPSTETERLKVAITAGDEAIPAAPQARRGEAVEVRDEPTIAVLPFVSLSDDPGREFFADGMSDAITSTLAKMPYMRVIARASTQIYKGRAVDVREVGREQGVRYVLDGTVKSAGERLRITVQLSDSESGHHVWSEKYDRTLGDIFELQDEITRQVTLALRVELLEGDQALFRSGGTRSLEAWEQFLQVTKHLNSHTRDTWPAARRAIDRALQIDPQYGSAWVALGWWHWEEAFCGWSNDPEASIAAALEATERAHQLSPVDPEPLLVLAMVHLQRRDFAAAEACMERARQLRTNHAIVPAIDANILMFTGRPEEALRQSRQAISLSPVYPPWYAGDVAQANLQLGRLDEAIEWAFAAIKRNEGYIHAHLYLVIAYHEQGKEVEARAAVQRTLKADPAFAARAWADAQPFKDSSINARFLSALVARACRPEAHLAMQVNHGAS